MTIGSSSVRWKEVFRVATPSTNGPLWLGIFAEDESEEHVDATEREEEVGRHESEVVDMMRENLGRDEALEDAQCAKTEFGSKDGEVPVKEGQRPAAFRHYSKISFRWLQSIGNALKRMMLWKMTSKLPTMAKKTPAG